MMMKIPEEILKDINNAKEILLSEGVREIYIFGSLVEGEFTER